MSSSISSTTTPTSANTLVTSTGIGSGLDITSIVTSLTTAAGLAQNTQLATRKADINAQVSAFGTFSSALSALQSSLLTLKTAGSLAGRTATASDPTIATGTATSAAVPGTYSLEVQHLATAASLSSKAFSSADATVGTGVLSISVGGKTATINIDSTHNTLSSIASAINGAANNPGISASILTTTDGARLVLSSTATGVANAINITQSGGDGRLAALTYTAGATTNQLTQTQAPTDAAFTINGFAATSASNQVSTAITGVTLNLLKTTTTNTPISLTVGADSTGAATSIGTFVKALNGLITAVNALSSYDPSTKTAGPLLGNATLQSFRNQLAKILGQVSTGSSGTVSLASLGITNNSDGSFSLDSTKLTNALTGNLSSVTGLLSGTNGLASQIDKLVTTYTQTGGLLDTVNKGLQSGLSDIAKQQKALDARLVTYKATLLKEYNAMDSAVALLKQTQSYLTQTFNPTSTTSAASTSLGSGSTSTTG